MRFKPTQLWWVLVPVFAASGLYMVKFQVRGLHDEIGAMHRQLERERAALSVLSAEWSYLNRPQRLQQTMDAHLKAKFVAPVQLATMADLPHVYAMAGGELPEAVGPQARQFASAAGGAMPAKAARGAYAQLQGQVTTSSLRAGGDE